MKKKIKKVSLKNSDIFDKYSEQVKKNNLADPIMLASVVTPIPGAIILGNAYTKAYSKHDRAKAYKDIAKHPFKSLVKAPIKVPKVAIKTALHVPKATYDFGKDVVNKVSHPKRTYKNAKKNFNKGIETIRNWKKKKDISENLK